MKPLALTSLLLLTVYVSVFGQLENPRIEDLSLGTADIFARSSYAFVHPEDSFGIDNISFHSVLSRASSEITEPYLAFPDSILWLRIPLNLDKRDENIYYVLENAYLFSAEAWLIDESGAVLSSFEHSYKRIAESSRLSNYPAWKFKVQWPGEYVLVLKVEDHDQRTKMTCAVLDEQNFNSYNLKNFLGFSFFIVFIVIVAVFIIFYSVATKEVGLLFYVGYLLFFIIDYAAIRGFGATYVWSDSYFFLHNVRSLSHGLIAFFGSLFFAYFYKSIDPPKWVLWYFRGFAILLAPCFVVYMIKFINPWFPSFYIYFWTFININLIGILCIHIYLAALKKLPYYLVLAFALPIATSQIRNHLVPDLSHAVYWLWNNSYFLAIVVEVCILTYFIYKQQRQKQLKLRLALNEAQDSNNQLQDRLHNGKVEILKLKSNAVIQLGQLLYIKSDGHYLEFHLENRKSAEIDRNTLTHLESELADSSCVRIHRSYIVNLDFVKSAGGGKVRLINGVELPMSRKMAANMEKRLMEISG